MILKLIKKTALLASLLLTNLTALAWDGPTDNAAWISLTNSVASNKVVLATLISQADAAGLNTDYAEVSKTVLDIYEVYAQYDRDNPSVMSNGVEGIWWGHKIPNSATYHIELPFDEMASCLDVSSNAIVELQQQLATNVVLQAPIDFSSGTLALTNSFYVLDGQPVFPSTFTWLLDDREDMLQAFGRMGGAFMQLTNLEPDGSITTGHLNNERNDAFAQSANNIAPQQFFLGHKPDAWMIATNSAITDGGRNFVQYDTDSPQIRGWLTQLFDGFIPEVAGPSGSGDQPRILLMANEPNFATRQGGWLANNGVSANTMEKYKQFLESRYTNDISYLNSTYGSSYANFAAARDGMTMPIPTTLQGGPEWYDWCRFNMDRVNDFFSFIKTGMQTNDPHASPTSIKILGPQLSDEWRDEGMDMEYLTKLQDVLGADNKISPATATDLNISDDLSWTNRYGLSWMDQSMMLDFTKSISPDKAFYDSEWHGLSTGRWRDFSMSREYLRAALWLGFTHGMSAMQAWYWPRNHDGSLRKGSIDAMIGSIVTLPEATDAYGRTFKELNAHAESITSLVQKNRSFLLYYCEESAIQDLDYIPDMLVTYEALKLINVPMGFTTPSEIAGISTNQTVIAPPAQFMSDASLSALQAFEAAGGKIVQVNGTATSFSKDEHGVTRGGGSGLSPYATVTLSDALTTAASLDAALDPIKPVLPVEVALQAYGVLSLQSVDPVSGESTVSLINVSKNSRGVSLLQSGQVKYFRDLITGQIVSGAQTMEPFDILLLQTGDFGYPLPLTTETVQWGEPGGDLNIVISNLNFALPIQTTYSPGFEANPIVGDNYYSNSVDRSPEFNAVNSVSANVKRVNDSVSGDYIASAKNNLEYRVLLLWENYLSGQTTLSSLAAEIAMNKAVDYQAFRWVVGKSSGEWYASPAIQTPGNSTYGSYAAADPGNLTWHAFDPLQDLDNVTFTVGDAGIDMDDITTVGLYEVFTHNTNTYLEHRTRYFKAESSPEPPANSWVSFVFDYGLTGITTDDADNDGQSDIAEYALGGDPTNAAVQGISPSITYHPDSNVSFYNLEVTNTPPGITYIAEWNTNLVSGNWNSMWSGGSNYPSATPGYSQTERSVYGGTNEHLFFRLKVSQP